MSNNNETSKEKHSEALNIADVSGSVLDFTPNNLSHIFRNISHKPCNSPCYDFAWDVTENGKFVGELFYSNEFREWNFIKDNYPSPRRAFKTSFPMDAEFFIKLFKAIKIDLQLVV